MDAAAAESLPSCPTLCDPIDGGPPGSPSLGFPRQEHWSGLPFPPPMKVKRESEVAQSCLTLSDPMDCSPPGSSVHGIFQAKVLEWGAITFSDGRVGHIYVKYRNTGHPRTYRLCVGTEEGCITEKLLEGLPGAGEVPSQSLSLDCGRTVSTQWSSFPCSYVISVLFCTRYPLRARVHAQSLSPVRLCTPCTAARQATLSTGFSTQEHWSGLP